MGVSHGWRRSVCAVALLQFSIASAGAQPGSIPASHSAQKSVLVLHTFGRLMPFRTAFDAGFESALQTLAPHGVDFFSESLDASHFPSEQHAAVMLEYLRGRYAGKRVDVVVAVLDPAFEFLIRHRAELFSGVPIVYMLSRQPKVEGEGAAPPSTGIWVSGTYRETIKVALKFHPETRRVIVVDSALDNGGIIEREIRDQLDAFNNQFTLTFLSDLPVARVVKAVSKAPDDSIILFSRQVMRTHHEA